MALTKVEYVDNETVISADNLNAIQDEIIRLGSEEHKNELVEDVLAALPSWNGGSY